MKAFLRTGLLLLPALLLGLLPASSPAQFGISVSINTAPPMLPVYSQPPCPTPGYLWEPGYWAWGPAGYYWVPGVWIMPPQAGLFWTPGYWGFVDGDYRWNDGYWGPEVGFYGGVDYGFGYPGQGFYGGMWQGNTFRYNVVVWHVGGGFHNIYRAPVAWHSPWHTRASFNGQGGIPARPTPQEERAMHARHYQPTPEQRQLATRFARDPRYQYKTNHGHPQVAAMARVSNRPAPARNARSSNTRTNARPNTRTNARPNTRTNARPNTRTNARPNTRTNTRTNTRVNTHTNTARPRTEARPQARATRPQDTHMQRPAAPVRRAVPARTESRPETRRPAAHAQPRPQARRAAPRDQARPADHAKPEAHPHPENHPKDDQKPHS